MTQTLNEKIRGCMLGAAVGDALGHPTEFLSMEEIRRRHGPQGVTGYTLHWQRGGVKIAPYTDDTQMSVVVLEALLYGRQMGFELDDTMVEMGRRLVVWSQHPRGGHRAPGNACLAGCRALSSGVSWREAGGASAGGCGSVMRAHPFGLLFAHDEDKARTWAVAHSHLTHRDPIALAACAAMATGICRNLQDDPVDDVCTQMIEAAGAYCSKTAAMMEAACSEATAGVGPEVTLDRLRGWAAHEAIAAALYVFRRHGDDVRRALLEGANTPGDSDSIASMTGALVGARVGISGIPPEWLRELEDAALIDQLASAVTSSP